MVKITHELLDLAIDDLYGPTPVQFGILKVRRAVGWRGLVIGKCLSSEEARCLIAASLGEEAAYREFPKDPAAWQMEPRRLVRGANNRPSVCECVPWDYCEHYPADGAHTLNRGAKTLSKPLDKHQA
jgi:hypothetical protein